LSFSLSRLGDSVQGETAYLVALIEDVTFQVHLGAQRERTHTLSAMGEMAAEVAHQIRNPLGGIELFASILGREVKGEPGLERLVSQVLGGAQEINHLINNYLALARPHQPIKKPVSVARLIEEAIQAAGDALQQKGIQTRVNAAEEAWVEGDEELLLQVFLNLVLNAVEALNPGGRLTVALSADRRRVEIRLTDTGRGIEPRDLDRLFNPFFTTKDKTLGLGLAVSHRIIDAHQGLIQVQGRPHQGATVTVTLPAMAMAPGRTSLL
jgi:signal transduction histidine kinase